jgi:cell division topological specificity factor
VSFIDRLLGRPAPAGSGTVAKERLKFVLEYDRAQLTPAELDLIRDDIIASISRHVDVAPEDVHVTLERGGRLVAEIPLGRSGRTGP